MIWVGASRAILLYCPIAISSPPTSPFHSHNSTMLSPAIGPLHVLCLASCLVPYPSPLQCPHLSASDMKLIDADELIRSIPSLLIYT